MKSPCSILYKNAIGVRKRKKISVKMILALIKPKNWANFNHPFDIITDRPLKKIPISKRHVAR